MLCFLPNFLFSHWINTDNYFFLLLGCIVNIFSLRLVWIIITPPPTNPNWHLLDSDWKKKPFPFYIWRNHDSKKNTVWVWKVLSCTLFSQRMEGIVILSKNGKGINPTGVPLSGFQISFCISTIMKNYCWSWGLSYNDLFRELLPLLRAFLLIGQKCKKTILTFLVFLAGRAGNPSNDPQGTFLFYCFIRKSKFWFSLTIWFSNISSSAQNFNLYTPNLYLQTS